MTDAYSKIGASVAANTRSKSIDFLDLLQPQRSDPRPNFEAVAEYHDDEINGERFGVVLGLSRRSVSSPADYRKEFQLEESKQKVGKYSAVKRVLSMRRSTSVSERYCRIHDQSQSPTAYDSMDEETGSTMGPKPVEKQQGRQCKGGKIIKACKRFLSLK